MPTLDPSKRVPAVLTRWGEPYRHVQIVSRGDALLRRLGVQQAWIRERMIGHMAVAAGWRQNMWNRNAWGVRVGTWTGEWYTKGTFEEENGQLVADPSAAWRSFRSWKESLNDYRKRISPVGRYAAAYAKLIDPDPAAASRFWVELGKAGYYTDTTKGSDWFGGVVNVVRQSLSKATDADRLEAELWVDSQLSQAPQGYSGSGSLQPADVPSWAVLGLLAAAGAILLAAALAVVAR